LHGIIHGWTKTLKDLHGFSRSCFHDVFFEGFDMLISSRSCVIWSGVPRDEIARENLRGLVSELTWCKASTAPLPTAREESPPPLPPPAVAPTKRSQPECIVKQEAARESKCSVAPATAQPSKRVKVEPEPQTGKGPPHPSAPLSQTFKKELSEISKRHMPVPVKAGSSRVCWTLTLIYIDVLGCVWLFVVVFGCLWKVFNVFHLF
jgi:hypothetical protein